MLHLSYNIDKLDFILTSDREHIAMKTELDELKLFLDGHSKYASTDIFYTTSLIERISHLYDQIPEQDKINLPALHGSIRLYFNQIKELLQSVNPGGNLKEYLVNLHSRLDIAIQYAPFVDQPMLDFQRWYMDRMVKCGYPITEIGMCYGLSYMALQAFLANDMATFNERLQLINNTSLQDCKCDENKTPFFNLRQKQQHLISEGKIDEAIVLNNKIIDMSAFFDGVALHQQPDKFDDFLPPDPLSRGFQNGQKTMQLTLPIALDTLEKKPFKIESWTGAYTKEELIEYLTLLKNNLGSTSFALQINSTAHAINLNYDSNTQQWLFVNPNLLPGQSLADMERLADLLLLGFGQTQGLVMETNLYTTTNLAPQMSEHYLNMKNAPAWKELHALSEEKINKIYPNIKFEFTQCGFAMRSHNYTWIEQTISKMSDATKEALFDFAKEYKDTSLMQIALHFGMTQTIFKHACYCNDHVLIQDALNADYKPTEQDLSEACRQLNNIELITAVMDKGDTPTSQVLRSAAFNKHFDSPKDKTTFLKLLIDTYHAPVTEELLVRLAANAQSCGTYVVRLLADKNIQCIVDLLQKVNLRQENEHVVNITDEEMDAVEMFNRWLKKNNDPLAERIRIALQKIISPVADSAHVYKERLTALHQTANPQSNTDTQSAEQPVTKPKQ